MRHEAPFTIQEALEFEKRWREEHRDDVVDQLAALASNQRPATDEELADAWR